MAMFGLMRTVVIPSSFRALMAYGQRQKEMNNKKKSLFFCRCFFHLRSGVVKLPRLADGEAAGAQNQNLYNKVI